MLNALNVRSLFPALLILGVSLAAYSNTWDVPFVFDDVPRIVENEAIRTAWPAWIAMQDTNRPLAFYSFALNYRWHELAVGGYHAVNLAIHVLAGWFLFGVVGRTLRHLRGESEWLRWLRGHSTECALVIALIWTAHPLQTQAVTYVVQRLESLMGLCYLATLYGFVLGVQRQSRRWFLASIIFCGLGMGCKEVMVTAPVLILWYDRVFVAENWKELWRQRCWYYVGLASTWGILAWAMLHFTGDYTGGALASVEGLTPWVYLYNQSAVILHYLKLSWLPLGQCFFYKWPVAEGFHEVWTSFLLMTWIALAALWLVIYRPRIGFLAGAVFVVLSPTSSLIPIQDLAFEHRMYLPLAFIASLSTLLAAWVLWRIEATPAMFISLSVMLVAVFGWMAYRRNEVYRSHVALWLDTTQRAPHNADAWTNLALAYRAAGSLEAARDAFAVACEVGPADAATIASYAATLLETGELELAEEKLRLALELDPHNYLATLNLGQLMVELGKPDQAIPYFEAVLAADPGNLSCQLDLAAALIAAGRYPEALSVSQQTLSVHGGSAQASVNLACALGGLGRFDEAERYCRRGLELDPGLANAHGTLALLLQARDPDAARQELMIAARLEPAKATYDVALGDLLATRDPSAAMLAYRAGLEKQPDSLGALLGLAGVLENSGRIREAIPHFEKALRLTPQWPELRAHVLQLKSRLSE